MWGLGEDVADEPARAVGWSGAGTFGGLQSVREVSRTVRHVTLHLWLCLGLATQAVAGTQIPDLQPTEGVFSSVSAPEPYYLAVRELLIGDHRYRSCQLLAIPSFDREWAVYVVREDANGAKVYNVLEKHLWSELMDELSGGGRRESYSLGSAAQAAGLEKVAKSVQHHSASIKPETREMLEQVWSRMLDRVHYPKEITHGADGTTYYVSQWQQGPGYRSGKTWSPEPGTPAAALVEIAEELRKYAISPAGERDAVEHVLVRKASALLSMLNIHEK